MNDFDIDSPEDYTGEFLVEAPSGAPFTVLTQEEQSYFRSVAKKYTDEYRFSNVSDLQDLDRILIAEVLSFRWGTWLSKEVDYWGDPIDTDSVTKKLNDYSKELRLMKKSLGMDKPARQKEKSENPADYIETMRQHAREFGYMRNEQAVKAITLFQELTSLIQYHDNCTEDERREEDMEIEDVIEWIRVRAIPEFQQIDRDFRETSQKYWDRRR